MSVVCIKSLRNTQGVVDVRTNDSTLDDGFIEAHANDARCTEGEDDQLNIVKLK